MPTDRHRRREMEITGAGFGPPYAGGYEFCEKSWLTEVLVVFFCPPFSSVLDSVTLSR